MPSDVVLRETCRVAAARERERERERERDVCVCARVCEWVGEEKDNRLINGM